ncbi:MAG: hypothetical protein KUG77_01110 [Nannocystaceae bacterium]|nr:hypothetical protein [Nannocystaceae bacterium]
MFGTRDCVACTVLLCTAACDLDSSLAPRVDLDVVVQATEVSFSIVDTEIELTEVRMALETVEFTSEGEMHARAGLLPTLHDIVVPTAFAHPGHSAGGEVVGELAGRYVVDFLDSGSTVGTATLLGAEYSGANFTFSVAEASDGLPADDPLIGHTALLAGTATHGQTEVEFVVYVDQDEGRSIIGLPLSFMATESSTEKLALRFDAVDAIEGDTIFADVDIVSLDEDADGFVEISADENAEAWANVRRNLQVHDHYAVEVIE